MCRISRANHPSLQQSNLLHHLYCSGNTLSEVKFYILGVARYKYIYSCKGDFYDQKLLSPKSVHDDSSSNLPCDIVTCWKNTSLCKDMPLTGSCKISGISGNINKWLLDCIVSFLCPVPSFWVYEQSFVVGCWTGTDITLSLAFTRSIGAQTVTLSIMNLLV